MVAVSYAVYISHCIVKNEKSKFDCLLTLIEITASELNIEAGRRTVCCR